MGRLEDLEFCPSSATNAPSRGGGAASGFVERHGVSRVATRFGGGGRCTRPLADNYARSNISVPRRVAWPLCRK